MNASFYTSCTVLARYCLLYQDDMGLTPVVDGYYSDYTNCFQVVSGEITAVSSCRVDCVVSDWSPCVNGIQTRSVITQPSGGGTECPVLSQPCTVVNSVEWSEVPYGYGGDPSGGFYQLNGTVEIIGDPVTFRAFVSIPDNAGPGSFNTSIYVGDTDDRYVEVVRPRDVDNERLSTSFTLPAGIYNWQVNNGWFGTGGGGEGGIVWTQAQ